MNPFKNINKLALVVVAIAAVAILGKTLDSTLFQSSILSLFNKIGITDYKEEYPDLGIDKITLTKIAEPSADFNYYKYRANVVLKNFGESVDKTTVVISSGEGQKKAFVRNELYGLTLDKGESFLFSDYEVLMTGDYNFRTFKFEIDIKDAKDREDENNSYTTSVLEDPAKLSGLEVSSRDARDGFYFDYDLEKGREEILNEMNLQICIAENLNGIEKENLRYAEMFDSRNIYSYYKIKANEGLIKNKAFVCEDARKLRGKYSVYKNFDLSDEKEYVAYLRAFNADPDSFAISNFIYLPKDSSVTKADFVKLFVSESGMTLNPSGQIIFKDVFGDEFFASSLQTMFNAGLVKETSDFEFHPDKMVLRRDVLEPLLNFYDVDLDVADGAPHFADVAKASDDYYFVEALYAKGAGLNLGIHFNGNEEASTYFVKYLINEFKTL